MVCVCVVCCVCCGCVVLVRVVVCVVVCGVVFVVVWHAENPVCAFKTLPCVPATCPHVLHMWACCRYTRERFERIHGDVLDAHTGTF